jgi:hypothetical protein
MGRFEVFELAEDELGLRLGVRLALGLPWEQAISTRLPATTATAIFPAVLTVVCRTECSPLATTVRPPQGQVWSSKRGFVKCYRNGTDSEWEGALRPLPSNR